MGYWLGYNWPNHRVKKEPQYCWWRVLPQTYLACSAVLSISEHYSSDGASPSQLPKRTWVGYQSCRVQLHLTKFYNCPEWWRHQHCPLIIPSSPWSVPISSQRLLQYSTLFDGCTLGAKRAKYLPGLRISKKETSNKPKILMGNVSKGVFVKKFFSLLQFPTAFSTKTSSNKNKLYFHRENSIWYMIHKVSPNACWGFNQLFNQKSTYIIRFFLTCFTIYATHNKEYFDNL